MESTIKTIKKMCDALSVSNEHQLALELGIKQNVISGWKNRKNVPIKYLQTISRKMNISMDSLLTDSECQSNSADTVKLHYYPNISASAGYGISNEDDSREVLEINRPFLMALGLRVFKNLDLISVFGDSMEPFISNGEMVIVERTHEAKNNEIVIANVNGEVYVKKLQRDPFGKCVKLISANSLYMDIELKDEELEYIKIIGVVRAKIRPF